MGDAAGLDARLECAGHRHGRGVADLFACQRRRVLAGEGVLQHERCADHQDVVGLRDNHFGNGAGFHRGFVMRSLKDFPEG